MKECRNVENKNRHFAPFQDKNMREILANLPRVGRALEDAMFSISSRYLLEKCVSTFLGKKAENFPKCEVTRLHYYINL
jgi:hypothetical protein